MHAGRTPNLHVVSEILCCMKWQKSRTASNLDCKERGGGIKYTYYYFLQMNVLVLLRKLLNEPTMFSTAWRDA